MTLPEHNGRELRALVASLDQARGRRESRLWKGEGSKCAGDMLGLFPCPLLIATEAWLADHEDKSRQADRIISVAPHEIERMSRLQSPPPVIALFAMPEQTLPPADCRELMLALDTVQDPGNLGTIIRTADWMGVRNILATTTTADCFGPKVVMATMGALARVAVHYVDSLADELRRRREAGVRVLGMYLDGENLYEAALPPHGDGCIAVMGNEGRGISAEVGAQVTDRLLIPPYPTGSLTSESLNVATAAAITLARLRFA